MGKRGASYRPDHNRQFQQPNAVPQIGLNQPLSYGCGQQAGDYNVAGIQRRIDRYAADDTWRSYSNGNGSLTVAASPYFNMPTQGLNPAAETFQPVQLGNHGAQVPSRNQLTNYQPLRSPNGVDKRHVAQGLTQTQPPPNTHRYALRLKPTLISISSDRSVPSVEPSTEISPLCARPWLEALRQPNRRNTPRCTVSPPPAPTPTKAYLDQARLPTDLREKPRPLLVILDLNGTLIVKPRKTQPQRFRTRPGTDELFDYLFKHHVVMIYTSSRPHNADAVVNNLFTKNQKEQLAAVWARDKLELTAKQYNKKVQVYKKLDKIWKNKAIQIKCPGGSRWDQTNTILIDDSHLKSLAQPYNLIQVPEFTAFSARNAKKTEIEEHTSQQEETLKSLIVKLEELKWQTDVSRLIMRWQSGKAKIQKLAGSGLLVDGKVDQKELAEADAQTWLPTPNSPSSDGGMHLKGLNDDVDQVIDLDATDNDLSVDGDSGVTTKMGESSLMTEEKCIMFTEDPEWLSVRAVEEVSTDHFP